MATEHSVRLLRTCLDKVLASTDEEIKQTIRDTKYASDNNLGAHFVSKYELHKTNSTSTLANASAFINAQFYWSPEYTSNWQEHVTEEKSYGEWNALLAWLYNMPINDITKAMDSYVYTAFLKELYSHNRELDGGVRGMCLLLNLMTNAEKDRFLCWVLENDKKFYKPQIN